MNWNLIMRRVMFVVAWFCAFLLTSANTESFAFALQATSSRLPNKTPRTSTSMASDGSKTSVYLGRWDAEITPHENSDSLDIVEELEVNITNGTIRSGERYWTRPVLVHQI